MKKLFTTVIATIVFSQGVLAVKAGPTYLMIQTSKIEKANDVLSNDEKVKCELVDVANIVSAPGAYGDVAATQFAEGVLQTSASLVDSRVVIGATFMKPKMVLFHDFYHGQLLISNVTSVAGQAVRQYASYPVGEKLYTVEYSLTNDAGACGQ